MEVDWQSWQPQIRANLLFVVRDGEILLIRKKRGIGAGKINGPGGKIDPGESALDSAVREVEEELLIRVSDPLEMGELSFQFTDGMAMHVVVFRASQFSGTPTETEEAIPLWFPIDRLPFDEMWEDDRHWLGQMIAGQRFRAWFAFDHDRMLTKKVEFLDPSPAPGR